MSELINVIKHKTHANAQEALMHGLKQALKIAAFVAVGMLAVHWFTGGQAQIMEYPEYHQSVPKEPAVGTPTYILGKHRAECWTMDQGPKAELPGAAIVQYPDGTTKYVTNDTPRGFKIVDAAFNEALASIGFSGEKTDKFDVIALCQ